MHSLPHTIRFHPTLTVDLVYSCFFITFYHNFHVLPFVPYSSNFIQPAELLEFAKRLRTHPPPHRLTLDLRKNPGDRDPDTWNTALTRLRPFCVLLVEGWNSTDTMADHISNMWTKLEEQLSGKHSLLEVKSGCKVSTLCKVWQKSDCGHFVFGSDSRRFQWKFLDFFFWTSQTTPAAWVTSPLSISCNIVLNI